MSKRTTILTVVIAAVLLLAVAVIALNAPNRVTDRTQTDTTTTQPETDQTQTPAEEEEVTDVAATITYTDGGFEPASVTVKSGDRIRIENKSSSSLSFNSDEHPTHTDQSELNVGNVAQGSSREFTVSETGTWGYHNHDNSSHTGEIVVE